ncbi:MAG: phosphate uptake regulator, PhoU [Acidobacteriales bacterium]|nr:phosphate uptake regulator, PhoU [Terriglobales bacterium]
MTRTRFQQGMDELKQKLLMMGGLAEQAVDRAVEGYRRRDLKLCNSVFESESAINRAERQIDELALDLLAMQQPMAVDLRFITACMKINGDLERVGDQAVNIAERGIELIGLPHVDLPVDIPRMAATAAGMIRRALEAFIAGNADLAEAVLKMDDIVDRMDDEVYIALVDRMHNNPEITQQALDALLISRNLERVADHATNIAEDVIFWVRGADVRHGGDHFKSFSSGE